MPTSQDRTRNSLAAFGLRDLGAVHAHLSTPQLFEEAVRRGEGVVSEHGALVVRTGEHTGRAAKDKYIVRDATTDGVVHFGDVNNAMTPEKYDGLFQRAARFLVGKEVFVNDLWVGADPAHRLPIRVITQRAYHSLFARNMFLRPQSAEESARIEPQYTIVNLPDFQADPAVDGTRSTTVVALNFTTRTVLIGGTSYAGEIKKSVFTIMNWILPAKGVLSMHCSANVGAGGDVAVFFGLSGTGKTTLSADPKRQLIGDDEHGWGDTGVFNLEGGCYAKVINLSAQAEPEIYATTRRFGTLLENVPIDDETRRIDLNDDRYTENTRGSYEIDAIPNIVVSGAAGQPQNLIFLTADAYGVMPPISRLSTSQAMYHFLSGYTARVAGTEIGVKEPKATFSACFGGPFWPLPPGVYAKLLGERIAKTGAKVWLVNTGWTGGPYGQGWRMKIAHTRAMLTAAITGALDGVLTDVDPVFGFQLPSAVPDVPTEVLRPRNTWTDKAAYDAQAAQLAEMFKKNFEKYAASVSAEVRAAGPK